MSNCRSCGGELFTPSAKRCYHCGAYQNWMSKLNLSVTSLALLTALISVSTVFVTQVFPLVKPTSIKTNYFGIQEDNLVIGFANNTNETLYIHNVNLVFFPTDESDEAEDVADESSHILRIKDVSKRVVGNRSENVFEASITGIASYYFADTIDSGFRKRSLQDQIKYLLFFHLYDHRLHHEFPELQFSVDSNDVQTIPCSIRISYRVNDQEELQNSAVSLTNFGSNINKLRFDSELTRLAFEAGVGEEETLDSDGLGFEFATRNACNELFYDALMQQLFKMAKDIHTGSVTVDDYAAPQALLTCILRQIRDLGNSKIESRLCLRKTLFNAKLANKLVG
ncbi:MAG: hypothetical protein ABJV04_19780 [Aliiglaciecola sp.]|uniref:hypothetical protein n=1 Tax=Aliiglaciecola sp. TaxID=1872441 RepID=UPI0032999649